MGDYRGLKITWDYDIREHGEEKERTYTRKITLKPVQLRLG
jgi:hypothetical protein